MMQSLTGMLNVTSQRLVEEKTKLRFKNPGDFKAAESLIIYEHSMLDEEKLLDCCISEYGRVVTTPAVSYVQKDIVKQFEPYNVFVINYDVQTSTIVVGTVPEFLSTLDFDTHYKVKVCVVPIYYYVRYRQLQFDTPYFLYEITHTDVFDLIKEEAFRLKASDITLSSTSKGAAVYYNVRKNRVPSKCLLSTDNINNIARTLASQGGAELADITSKPRYFSVVLSNSYRGRVVINRTYYGFLVTIRVLSNDVLDTKLEELNINQPTCEFIRRHVLSLDKGLRLFIGETMSGKNTTILSALTELIHLERYKIVSVEQPVEIIVDGLEQITTETDDEFVSNADSLLRQNPDFVYFTEITARTATSIMQQANTAKAVFSSIHANSISDVLFRLQDITKMPLDRLLLCMHSCVYQELRRDDSTDTVKPYNRCVYFDDELKMKLYGKDVATVKSILQEYEKEWDIKNN